MKLVNITENCIPACSRKFHADRSDIAARCYHVTGSRARLKLNGHPSPIPIKSSIVTSSSFQRTVDLVAAQHRRMF